MADNSKFHARRRIAGRCTGKQSYADYFSHFKFKKMIYIKITLPGEENGYIDTVDNAKKAIQDMADGADRYGDFSSFEFTVVEMTEDEFESLPEFRGF